MNRSALTFMPKFFDRYILLIDQNTPILEALAQTENDFEEIKDWMLANADYKYGPEKWTVKQVLQHVIDNERIQSYRALAISRGETASLPGYNEDVYANNATTNHRTMEGLLDEFKTLRQSTIHLFNSFNSEMMHKKGVAFEIEITALAVGFQIVGHGVHHLNILKERYFK